MKRFTVLSYLALVLLFLVLATQSLAQSSIKTVVDQRGKEIRLPDHIEKIVTFAIPLPLVIYALDGNGNRIVGMHPKSKAAMENDMFGVLAPELKSANSTFIKGKTMFNVNIEEIVKISPDVVFQWSRMKEDIRMMEKAGIPVVALNVRTYEDVLGWIRIVGEVLEKQEKAEALIAYHHQTIDLIKQKLSQRTTDTDPRAMVITNARNGNISVVGKHPFYNFVTQLTGMDNCAKEHVGKGGSVNMEQVMIWNPEIIFIGNLTRLHASDLLQDKGWQHIQAVKKGQVYKIPDGAFWWYPPGLESPLYFQWLAKKCHPELLKDVDMVDEIKAFYHRFYNHALSDDDAVSILEAKK